MAILIETMHCIATKFHHGSFCGTVSKDNVIWDVYTLGFCSVATNGKDKMLLDDTQLEYFVFESEIISWVVAGDIEYWTKPRQRRFSFFEIDSLANER